MAPHRNTRSRNQPQIAPLPPPTRRSGPRAAVTGAVAVAATNFASLLTELRIMVIKQCNENAKYSDLNLACRPKKNDRAHKTDLCLVGGHPLSAIARWLAWEADSNYPFGIIRENQRDLYVEIDMSSRNINNSMWAICATLSANHPSEMRLAAIR
jgi:hypothetical protein